MTAPTVTRLEPETFDWTRGAGGAAEVRRIAAAASDHDGHSVLNEAALLTLTNHNLDTGILLTGSLGDTTDGFAYVHGLSGGGRPELDLVVSPAARRHGLGLALARAALEIVDGIPLTAWSHGNHPGAGAIAPRVGFAAVRELWLMRRPASLVPVVPTPPGVTIRPFEPGQDDEGFLAVNAEAFAGHPEQGGLDARGLEERMAEPWFDPAGFLVASREDRIVGFHWTKVHPVTPPHGEVYVIGVHPSQQGTGLGKALLAAGLAHLESQGLEEVVLYVEAANATAIALYEAFGFTHAASDTDVMYAPA